MKAIIFAAGSDGDIHPHLGIGCELIARGHQVVFITSLNYVKMARSCGFEALSCLGWDEKQEFDDAEGLGITGKIKARCRFFSDKVSKICEMVAGLLDEQSILIAPPFGYTMAKLLHMKYRVPYISTALAPSNILCSLKNPPSFKSMQWFSKLPYPARKLLFRSGERLVIDPFFRMLLKKPAQKLDLLQPPPRRVMSEWLYSPQKIVGLFPDWFAPTPEDWPDHITLTGFPLFHPKTAEQQLSAGLSGFLDAGQPPIVFTAGTDTQTPQTFFEAALKITQTLGVRGVFLTRLTDQLPKLPNTIWHESYTSLQLLLPRAGVLVHHGGIGTTAQALRAGIPQFVFPERMDQLDNGLHLEHLGCGLVHQSSLNSSAGIEKLRHLLTSPQVRSACRSTQTRMDAGAKACSRTADVIEETFYSTGRTAEFAQA